MWIGFAVLSIVNVLNGFSYMLAYYVINEHANDAIKNLYFPNVTLNSTDNVGCDDKNITSEEKNVADIVQEKVSQWSIYYSLAKGIPCLISSSLYSTFSDRYGRKLLLFLSLVGTCMKMVLCTIAIHYNFNIYLFVLVGFVEGCAGGWITVLSISFAYVADLTSTGNYRSIAIAIFESILGLGFISGIISSGFLIKLFDGYFFPSVISTAAMFLALFASRFLPETVRRSDDAKKSHVMSQMKELLGLFVKKSSHHDTSLRFKYILCFASINLVWLSLLGAGDVELYFFLSYPICFNAEVISIYSSTRDTVQKIMTVVMIRVFQLFGIRDETTGAVSCMFGIAKYVVLGLATTKEMLYIDAAIDVFKFACVPILRSTMSKLTPEDKQGSIFGAIAFFENICNMCGTVMAGAIYSATVPIYRGFVFFVMAGYTFLATALIIVLSVKMKGHTLQRKYDDYEKIQEN